MIDWRAPSEPGVYLFKDASGKIVYVGKAASLANRLSNYRSNSLEGKSAELMRTAASLELIACRNETEALVLENTLIKQHRPTFNILLKDSVQYAYVKVTNEEFPRLLTTRKKDVLKGEKLLGPYVSGQGRSIALRETSRLFGIRICNPLPKQACLQYQLGFCTAPCIGKISKEDYAANVDSAVAVLSGKTQKVEESLSQQMQQASQEENFERALELRNRLEAIGRIKQRQLMESQNAGNEDFFGFVKDGGKLRVCVLKSRAGLILGREQYVLDAIGESPEAEFILRYYDSQPLPEKAFASIESASVASALSQLLKLSGGRFLVPQKGDKLELVKLAEKNAALAIGVAGSSQEAIALQKALGLIKPPSRLDCFDVSNLAGKQVVGSCVRLLDGKPEKSFYRRFRVRTVTGQDDFASMKEIVFRRYRGALEKGEPLPDFVLIDGGIGQLHAAMEALSELSLELPIASLAKKEEEIYLPDLLKPLKIGKSHAGLRLLMRARDEAHRFAITYNRKRREMESPFAAR